MSQFSMSGPELQLLLAGARLLPDGAQIRELVSRGLDWHRFLKLARRHDVMPLLRRSLKLACWDVVPWSVQVEFEAVYRDVVIRNLFLTAELLRVIDAFSREAVPIATFKGPALAEDAYGDLSLRTFCDLDILVHEADLRRAERILVSCGYEACLGDQSYRSAFLSYHGQYAFRSRSEAFFDLHWRLSGKGVPFPVRAEEVWAGLRDVSVEGRVIRTFSEDELTLFLAAHGTKEGWRNLKWVCDFAEFVRVHDGIDWGVVYDRANRSRCIRPLLLAVHLAATLLDAPVPAELLDRARHSKVVRTLARRVQLRLSSNTPQSQLQEFLSSLPTHDRSTQRLVRVATQLTTRTTGDHRAVPLPHVLWCLYFLIRPFRLAYAAMEALLCWVKTGHASTRPVHGDLDLPTAHEIKDLSTRTIGDR